MRKKEAWMKQRARVTACGDKGTLTRIEGENTINGVDYVYYLRVKLDGAKMSQIYHPADVQQLIEDNEG